MVKCLILSGHIAFALFCLCGVLVLFEVLRPFSVFASNSPFYHPFLGVLIWSLCYSWLDIVCFVFNAQSLFHRNTRLGKRAVRVLVGLGQNRLFPCSSEIPREGYFTVGGE